MSYLYSAAVKAATCENVHNRLLDRAFLRSSVNGSGPSPDASELRRECSRLSGCLFTSFSVSSKELEPSHTLMAVELAGVE
jgi:hypothetical protein